MWSAILIHKKKIWIQVPTLSPAWTYWRQTACTPWECYTKKASSTFSVPSHTHRATRYLVQMRQLWPKKPKQTKKRNSWQRGLCQHPVFVCSVALFFPFHFLVFLISNIRIFNKTNSRTQHIKIEDFPLNCDSISGPWSLPTSTSCSTVSSTALHWSPLWPLWFSLIIYSKSVNTSLNFKAF